MVRNALRLVVGLLVYGAALFIAAGTVAWPGAWGYLVIASIVMVVYGAIVRTRHPELIAERKKPPADAKRWDKPFVALIGGVGPVALLVVSGLDRRFGWSGPMASWVVVSGLVLAAAGGALANWAVAVNRFFSAVVRIQHDRGHHVVATGPYRFVRHPGYLGSTLTMTGAALALGSWWALLTIGGLAALVVWRTALEDRTLMAELEGYTAYSERVRFRLIRGIW